MTTEPKFTIKASHPDAVKLVSHWCSLCSMAGDDAGKQAAIQLTRDMRAWRDAPARVTHKAGASGDNG